MSDKYLRSEKQNLVNAIGTDLCWGWSPAVNMLELLDAGAVKTLTHPLLEQSSTAADDTKAAPSSVAEEAASTKGPAAASSKPVTLDDLDNLINEIDKAKNDASKKMEDEAAPSVHMLLCGACDIRHILRTLADLKIRQKKKENSDGSKQTFPTLHFHVYEPNLRVLSRHVFFLQWLCDAVFSLDELEDRVAMFLEVLGNAMLRDITATQAKDVAVRAIRTMNGDHTSSILHGRLHTGDMKAKERDFVEEQMRHWVRDASVAKVDGQWNQRLRTEMAERYDNKDNIIDWDYNFHLYEYTNAIKFPEYRVWRNSGVAFDYCHINPRKGFQYEYTVPNKTLCHFGKHGVGAYNGDIKNGPFYAVGISTQNKALHPRNADGALKYGNGVAAMHNVRAWLYELMTGKQWEWADHKFAWDDLANYNYLPPGTPSTVQYHAEMPAFEVHLIGLDLEKYLQQRADQRTAYQTQLPRKFDAVFVGSNCAHVLNYPLFFDEVTPTGTVVCETVKFVIDCKDEAKALFEDKLREFAQAFGWKQDAEATSLLHRDQPEERKSELALTEPQRKSLARYKSFYQLAFKKVRSTAK